ncbi:4522_t:CDS:1, partial [Funneliformis caledonium]
MLTESLDDETAYWDTPYKNSARIVEEEANEVKKLPRVQSNDDIYFDEDVNHNSTL